MAWLPSFTTREPTRNRVRAFTTPPSFSVTGASTASLSEFFRDSIPPDLPSKTPPPLPKPPHTHNADLQMEKMLKKSKSRYFFGKKKSAKDQGISSSDVLPGASTGRNETFPPPQAQTTPPQTTPRMFPSGASVLMIGGAGANPARPLPTAPEHAPFQMHSRENHARPFDPSTSSKSRFEVHISPTAFSPIMMPSSTPPRPPYSPSVSASPSRQHGNPPSNPQYTADAAGEFARRAGDLPAHARSQSSMTPDQTLGGRSKLRRHAIPANFMDMSGGARETNNWNGQSLGAERYMDTHTSQHGPSSFSSDPSLVRPSASAPATSYLPRTDNRIDLAPLRESSTAPSALSSSSGPSPLPRSNPSYNLAALTPSSSSSATSPLKSSTEAEPNSPPKPHRSAPVRPPGETQSRPHRDPPPQPPPASPVTKRDASSATSHYHTPSSSVNSEIGYKGLAFPLPPSSEEGLAMSFSSSQSSLFSVASGRMPVTPRKSREGKEEKTPKSSGSRGTGPGSERGEKERRLNVSKDRASPTPSMGAMRRRREHEGLRQDAPSANASGTDTDGERETIRNVHERVTKELEEALGVEIDEDEFGDGTLLGPRSHTTSDAARGPSPTPARVHTQPTKPSEPTKPLSFTPGRKTLHTMRSISTGLGDRKQLHTSTSHRDLSASFQGVNARGERIRTTTTIPVRVGAQSDRDVPSSSTASSQPPQSDFQQQIPPSFPLPTPPNSSNALSFLAGEKKNSGNAPQLPQARPHPERLPVGPGPRPTLEDVTNALRAQRGQFDELAGYVLDVAQRHALEKDAYTGRIGLLEGAITKMEREIRGLRWLVLENAKRRSGAVREEVDAENSNGEKDGAEKRLRRSSTMPHLPKFLPLASRPTHARSKRDAIGLGLGFSPDSALSSPSTLSPTEQSPPARPLDDIGERTPSMDEIIDKLMAVRQWSGADVRVSVVEGISKDGGDSKRIVFREG